MRVIVEHLPGGQIIHPDLPVVSVEVTNRLNAPRSAKIVVPATHATPLLSRLAEWGAAMWVEDNGVILGGGLITTAPIITPDTASFELTGTTSYLADQPWQAAKFSGIKVDPLDMARKIWNHIQTLPGGNLGVIVDGTKSPVRIGEPEKNVAFTTGKGEDVSFQAGPYKLEPWSTNNLGQEFTKLAQETPFDYLEEETWNGHKIEHRLRLGYPRLGALRRDLSLVVGENVTAWPAFEHSAPFANAVTVWGAGEGEKMTRSDVITTKDNRLRRCKVVTDKKCASRRSAVNTAHSALKASSGGINVAAVKVIEHARAPISQLRPGDSVRVIGYAVWGGIDQLARISEVSMTPGSRTAQLKLEKVG